MRRLLQKIYREHCELLDAAALIFGYLFIFFLYATFREEIIELLEWYNHNYYPGGY